MSNLTYQTCTPGQRALGVSLVGLPRHRLDEGKINYLTELLDKFTGTPEEVLFSVAAEVDDLAEHGLRQQPRYSELATMIAAALAAHNEIMALIRSKRREIGKR